MDTVRNLVGSVLIEKEEKTTIPLMRREGIDECKGGDEGLVLGSSACNNNILEVKQQPTIRSIDGRRNERGGEGGDGKKKRKFPFPAPFPHLVPHSSLTGT